MKVLVALVLASVTLAPATAAAAAAISLVAPTCIPEKDNAPVVALVQPPNGWASVRVYFRVATSPTFYYLEMRAAENGRYWAVLPKPEEWNKLVDLQVAVKDAEGEETRGTVVSVPVTSSCDVDLAREQATFANNLVVGETAASQIGREVCGFMCDGIISRIDYTGEMRPDDYCCHAMLLFWASKPTTLPLLLIGGVGGGISIVDHHVPPPASPARP